MCLLQIYNLDREKAVERNVDENRKSKMQGLQKVSFDFQKILECLQ